MTSMKKKKRSYRMKTEKRMAKSGSRPGVKKPKVSNDGPMMMIPGMNVEEIVSRTIEMQVKKRVSERIDQLILSVIHGSSNLGIWCPHRDDNMIRLTTEAREHIRAEIRRSFNEEILHQVCEMSESLRGTIKQRVDENMALFEVGQGNWVFKIMADQIKAHIAKTIAKTVNGLTIQSDPDAGE